VGPLSKSLRLVFALAVISLGPGSGCSAFRSVKEKQSTAAQGRIDAGAPRVYGAALAVLPEFHLIATADYPAAGLIEARGDWGSPSEGIVVQISVKAEDDAAVLVVEAGRSTGRSRAEMRDFARAVRDRIVHVMSTSTVPAS
jgi:hypothetical protein